MRAATGALTGAIALLAAVAAAQHHTTTSQLVELATKARPKLLVLSHTSLSLRPAVDSERSTPAAMLREMAGYSGQVVVGRDLDVY